MPRTALLLSLLLAPLALAQTPAPPATTAKVLNTEGFRLYQEGKYPEALEKFREAVGKDPKHALAQYNVAATLGVLRKQGKVCEYEAYPSTILQYLIASVKLDPKRLKRAKEDADLEPIRETLGWQRLLGRAPTRTADVPEILKKVRWYAHSQGVYGTIGKLTFQDGGKVVRWKKTPQEDGSMKEEEITGTYKVKGRKVEVSFPGQAPDTGTITGDDTSGKLSFKGLGDFYDFPSECDA
ncbi:hypothetical protein [Hyalangium rubrum]|uniref:Tetratricopeptide repeat protein n=1 Tax=Hyalangium rubrum TaxID=3103134 RepID=A0ABU5H380_9BACT|nr:hypothetical protein [Hyalangium sp. s54d21]MDY7227927.1 hypothetical protein [Hyalangium sp. s54d21]